MTLYGVNEMGSGLSMTSVNKIKELASSKEYSLALDIVKNQDLSKSLNPQFLRLCGEIYLVNGCYNEAREVLLMAHKMAPEGKRIIYFLIDLYLRMGFKELAKTYYELYLFDADETADETKQLKYIYAKSQRLSVEELESYIISKYVNNMDYDWSFEAYLLLKIKNETEKVNILIEDYKATFKNSDNVLLIEDIEEGRKTVEECYYVYSEEEKADDDERHETLRKQEQILLEQDDIRIHPREPEITIMIDDREEPEIGSKFRLKRFLKEQKKLEEKIEKEKLEQESNTDDVEETSKQAEEETKNNENVTDKANDKPVTDEQVNETSDLDGKEQDSEESGNKVFSSLKKIFKKKKKEEKTEDSSEIQDEKSEDKNDEDKNTVTVKEETTTEQTEILANKQEEEQTETAANKQEEEQTETAADKQEEEQAETAADKQEEEQAETAADKQEEEQTVTAAENQDDGFNAKSKTMKFVFEDAVVVDEESEFEVDDFSSVYDDEFGEMNAADEDILEQNDELTKDTAEEIEEAEAVEEATEEIEEAEFVEEAAEEIEEAEFVEEVAEEIEEAEFVEEVAEEIEEAEFVEEAEEEIEEAEFVEEAEEEIEEAEIDDTEDLVEDEYVGIDEAKDNLAEFENTYEGAEESNDIEEINQEVWKEEKEEVPETFSEKTDEVEEEKNGDYSSENQEDDSEACLEETEQVSEEEGNQNQASENEVNLYDEAEFHKQWEEKNKRINFPVFKTSLFPTYNSETVEVENNFNEVMSDAQDKMHDNLLKEEQMQKEAEALLASLGIDINGVTTSDEKTVVSNNGPSRDEIKASLKIDSVKKNILIKLKDYR